MPMQAAEKHKMEMESLKASRIQHIIACSYNLFAEQGFDVVTMNEIAKVSEIGVASLYRYFSTKEDLAIECAIYAWNVQNEFFRSYYESEEYKTLSGYEQLKALLNVFPLAYAKNEQFFRFVYYFDAFIHRQNVSKERLMHYEQGISTVSSLVIAALEKGESDGSITYAGLSHQNARIKRNEVYFTITHSLFSMVQKMALSSDMLAMNTEVMPEQQIALLVAIILESLR